MTKQRLRILHLSDLHIGKQKPENAYRVEHVMGEAWDRNLTEIRKDGQINLVCFTGDLAQSGRADQYHRLKDVIRNVQARVDCPLQRFFCVPGNHDIDRGIEKNVWRKLRPALANAPHAFGDWFAENPPLTAVTALRKKTEVACRRVSRTSRATRCWPGSRRIAIFSSKRGWRIRSPHGWANLIRTWAIAKPFPPRTHADCNRAARKVRRCVMCGCRPGHGPRTLSVVDVARVLDTRNGGAPFVASTISALTPGAVDASRFQPDRECGAIQNVL
jgi:hypothetical protein